MNRKTKKENKMKTSNAMATVGDEVEGGAPQVAPGQMPAPAKTPGVPAVSTPKVAKGKPLMKKKIRSIQDLKDAAQKSKFPAKGM